MRNINALEIMRKLKQENHTLHGLTLFSGGNDRSDPTAPRPPEHPRVVRCGPRGGVEERALFADGR